MQSYTPPRGTGSTKDYDRAIRLWAREKRWRAAMLAMLRPDWRLVIADYGRQHGSHAARLPPDRAAARWHRRYPAQCRRRAPRPDGRHDDGPAAFATSGDQ